MCHTDHAVRITTPNFVFAGPYDESFVGEMTHVIYPSIFQRRTDADLQTVSGSPFRQGGALAWYRDFGFNPVIYLIFDFLSAHACWVRIG